MPPKPQVFKTPDGKEFSVRTEWRDYMMATFFSYKNKVNEPAPLIRMPGSIEGQMYDIADCENSTLLLLDHSEQVQIDQCKNCRIFIGACASSIFIRNCENCTFYTCCRQSRLRDVVNCTFYVYSMAEVHIEFSKGLKFAPFNGGYPDHEKHLKQANLDINHNLWYDIYDHNDAAKSRVNWSLLPEEEYEAPWFPLGECIPAVPRTKAGGVFNPNNTGDAGMQSFSLQQMVADAAKIGVSDAKSPAKAAPAPPAPAAAAAAAVVPPPAPAASSAAKSCCGAAPCATAGAASATTSATASTEQERIKVVIEAFVGFQAGEDLSLVAHATFQQIQGNGQTLTLSDMSAAAPVLGNKVCSTDRLVVCATGHFAYATYWATEEGAESGKCAHCTAVLQKDAASALGWVVVHVQKSAVRECGSSTCCV